MAIEKPGKVLLHHIPLKSVTARVSGDAKRPLDARIALVPFIDFLIVLVVFLLSTMGRDSVNVGAADIRVPDAEYTQELHDAPVIAINNQVVLLEGIRVADTGTLAESSAPDPIAPLVEGLETLARNWPILHPNDPFPGTVVLLADQAVDFRVIKKAMASAAGAGYANVSFAVNSTSS